MQKPLSAIGRALYALWRRPCKTEHLMVQKRNIHPAAGLFWYYALLFIAGIALCCYLARWIDTISIRTGYRHKWSGAATRMMMCVFVFLFCFFLSHPRDRLASVCSCCMRAPVTSHSRCPSAPRERACTGTERRKRRRRGGWWLTAAWSQD